MAFLAPALPLFRQPPSPRCHAGLNDARSVTSSSYPLPAEQIVGNPLGGTMFWQVGDHALCQLTDVSHLTGTLRQKCSSAE